MLMAPPKGRPAEYEIVDQGHQHIRAPGAALTSNLGGAVTLRMSISVICGVGFGDRQHRSINCCFDTVHDVLLPMF